MSKLENRGNCIATPVLVKPTPEMRRKIEEIAMEENRPMGFILKEAFIEYVERREARKNS